MDAPFALPGSGPVQRFEDRESIGFLPRGWIDGLVLSNDTTDATNDIAIAAGVARSTVRIVNGAASTLTRDQMDLDLPISVIKQLDVAFAPENYDPEGYSGGDRSGGRSSSSVSNTTWHYFLVGGGGLQTDVLIHDSATQSNVLAEMQKVGGYTAYRHLGSLIRSTTLATFTQSGDYFFIAPASGYSATNPGTSAVTSALSNVPSGIALQAILSVCATAGTSGSGLFYLVSSLSVADTAPSSSVNTVSTQGTSLISSNAVVLTDTSAQVRTRASASGGSDVFRLTTQGWIHPRGKNA